ncbi:cysteine hydrolase family protein [Campylobacter gastrosuis]|uniref:Cysteine hydrolase n=1 Tax=Campylobacter gastrosuis TaxID=2974576 RepID=A0ABT7HMZ8_9BACT|nr:isochorismatase family cysteine hydrolase [Campylobacter gastrosuis]MDL0088290.1 cysteine hydrolase [Campylobacter gastrosuis]
MKLDLTALNPKNTAIISVDMINAFCKFGALSSQKCGEISQKAADFLSHAYELGFLNILLIQDLHDENSSEFLSFKKHAVKGLNECEAIDEIKNLSFYEKLMIFNKNSLSIAYNENFNAFLRQNPHIDTFVIFGVCTDLCVYSTISHLALSANEQNLKRRLIVVKDLCATFDAPNHDADFYNEFFLNHAKFAFNAEIKKLG